MTARTSQQGSPEARFPVIEGGKARSHSEAFTAPSFATLEHDPMFWRLATNLAACISAPARHVPKWSWAHAPMFRSAHFRKRYPLRAFLTSLLLHVAGFSALISLPDLRSSSSQLSTRDARAPERTIIYYTKADLLPPIAPPKPEPRQARPRPAAPRVQIRPALHPVQEIVSKPATPDNRRQTIIQPAPLQLRTEIRVPNLVSWAPQLTPPAPSVSEAKKALAQIHVPELPAPKVAVLRPMPSPPRLETLSADAASVPLAPVPTSEIPKLPVPIKITRARRPPEPVAKPAPEPRATPDAPRIQAEANAPLPDVFQNILQKRAADLVAVSLAPAPPEKEIVVPEGSRAGEFQASPQGADMESGPVEPTSEVVATSAEANTAIAELAGREMADIRVPGLSVSGSSAPQAGTIVQRSGEDFKRLLARATRPSLVPEMSRERPLETEFFGNRRFYTTYLNMPNLSSGSGSWVLRFAELDDESAAATGELSKPEPIRKVDPAYAPSAARERIQGTVMLAALLLKDGSIANIRVVRSLDSRLDSSAVSALTQWQFRPATRNGAPVNLEVLVQIPFRLPSF